MCEVATEVALDSYSSFSSPRISNEGNVFPQFFQQVQIEFSSNYGIKFTTRRVLTFSPASEYVTHLKKMREWRCGS
jgi:hypothetical protein